MTEEAKEDQAPEAPQDQTSEPKPAARRRRPVLWAVLILALGAGGAYATWPLWRPSLRALFEVEKATVELDPAVATLAGRVNELEGRVRAIGDAAGPLRDLEAEKERITAQVDGLVKRVVELEQAMDAVKKLARSVAQAGASDVSQALRDQTVQEISQRLSTLEENDKALAEKLRRLDQLEEFASQGEVITARLMEVSKRVDLLESAQPASASASATAQAMVIAVSQLRQTLTAARPFTQELESLKAVAAAYPDVIAAAGKLEPLASGGVPTLSMLRAKFDRVATDIAAARTQAPSEDWIERTFGRLKSLVTLRRIDGETSGDPVEAALMTAETALRTGDLEAAIAALEGLDGPPKAAANAWLADARARLLVERTLAGLHVQVVSLLAAGPEAQPSKPGE